MDADRDAAAAAAADADSAAESDSDVGADADAGSDSGSPSVAVSDADVDADSGSESMESLRRGSSSHPPGDGDSCPFTFPDPQTVGQPMEGIWAGVRILDLRSLIELKLASSMTAPHRPRDMDDVIRLIKIHGLPRAYSGELHEYVRGEYDKLWELAQVKDRHEEESPRRRAVSVSTIPSASARSPPSPASAE